MIKKKCFDRLNQSWELIDLLQTLSAWEFMSDTHESYLVF